MGQGTEKRSVSSLVIGIVATAAMLAGSVWLVTRALDNDRPNGLLEPCLTEPAHALSIYLRDDASESEIEELRTRLVTADAVETVRFTSKKEALAEFEQSSDDDSNPYVHPPPGAVLGHFDVDLRDDVSVGEFASSVQMLRAIEEIRYGGAGFPLCDS